MLTGFRDWAGGFVGRLKGDILGRRETVRTVRGTTSARPRNHVVILDGTMSSLDPGLETNAGLTYRLLREMPASAGLSLKYEPGLQWTGLRRIRDIIVGVGFNRQIRRSYGFIASRYRPGDRIYLFGFSRGAYAVRSLAGMIDRMGLLKAEHATERMIREAYRHYQSDPDSRAAGIFRRRYCHIHAPVQMVGVWDTVKSLGIRLPVLWRVAQALDTSPHEFHNHRLGPSILHGYHALALDETRLAFDPVLWDCPPDFTGHVEQMWFRGTHGDIGGHLSEFSAARPLSNIPLVWMLDKAEACGLELPEGWRARFPQDPSAKSVGTLRGWGKLFVIRRRRRVGRDRSEAVHPSVGRHPLLGAGPRTSPPAAEAMPASIGESAQGEAPHGP
ncbi:putative alpha/beta hydrolase family protein DUF2235 [Brevirhabdus pacifica]|nr:putative alpha/beta hydrolase family protein DUF2235 [Brevirhabdus pacifica]